MWARTPRFVPPVVEPWWQTLLSPRAAVFRTPRATGRTAFKRLAEIVRDYVKKGSKLYLDGKIQTRSWDDKETGAKRYRTEIIVNDLSLLSAREEGGGYSRPSNAPTNMDQRRPAANDEYSQAAEISDDDIPF